MSSKIEVSRELAELQATIARLTAENEQLKSEPVEGLRSALAECVAQRDAHKAEIERLKGGQGEPVAYQRMSNMDGGNWWFLGANDIEEAKSKGWTVRALYASQPAPVSSEIVQLLERAKVYARGPFLDEINACLEKAKDLNP